MTQDERRYLTAPNMIKLLQRLAPPPLLLDLVDWSINNAVKEGRTVPPEVAAWRVQWRAVYGGEPLEWLDGLFAQGELNVD